MRGARLSRKFFQMPSVYDVAIENQAVAIDVAQEMADFFCFGMRGTQMNVGEHERAVMPSLFHVLLFFLGRYKVRRGI